MQPIAVHMFSSFFIITIVVVVTKEVRMSCCCSAGCICSGRMHHTLFLAFPVFLGASVGVGRVFWEKLPASKASQNTQQQQQFWNFSFSPQTLRRKREKCACAMTTSPRSTRGWTLLRDISFQLIWFIPLLLLFFPGKQVFRSFAFFSGGHGLNIKVNASGYVFLVFPCLHTHYKHYAQSS